MIAAGVGTSDVPLGKPSPFILTQRQLAISYSLVYLQFKPACTVARISMSTNQSISMALFISCVIKIVICMDTSHRPVSYRMDLIIFNSQIE